MIRQKAVVTLCFQWLELEQEEGKEVQELLEKKQQNLLQFAELEREVVLLRNENRNLQYVAFFILCSFMGCSGCVALDKM